MNSRQTATILLCVALSLASFEASAAIDNSGILDQVLARYYAAASTWGGVISAAASRLFWSLATISMVWTFGQLALRKADIAEFFGEFIKFTVFTGFFWWLLMNGPNFAASIYESLRLLAGSATGLGGTLAPSQIVDIGFAIFNKVANASDVFKPIDSLVGILIAGIVLAILAVVAINMLKLLVSGWILAYSGIFFLGFGGSRWTADMAINYYKTVLSVAAQLMAMVLLVGIGQTILDDYYRNMSGGVILSEMAVILIVAVVLLLLTNEIPPLIAGIASGASLGLSSGVGNMGAGDLSRAVSSGVAAGLGAAGAAVGAASVAGSLMSSGAANIAGGAQALMAAVSKAQSNVANDSDVLSFGGGRGGDAGAAGAGANSSSDGSDYAQAAGYADMQGMTSAGRASSSLTANDAAGAMRSADGQAGGADTSVGSSASAGASDMPTAMTSEAAGGAPADATPDTGGNKAAGTGKALADGAGYVGRVAADAVANLAKGTGKVAMDKARAAQAAASERIGNTVGGKIAATIGADVNKSSESPQFGGDMISSDARPDWQEEIAAFVRGRAASSDGPALDD